MGRTVPATGPERSGWSVDPAAAAAQCNPADHPSADLTKPWLPGGRRTVQRRQTYCVPKRSTKQVAHRILSWLSPPQTERLFVGAVVVNDHACLLSRTPYSRQVQQPQRPQPHGGRRQQPSDIARCPQRPCRREFGTKMSCSVSAASACFGRVPGSTARHGRPQTGQIDFTAHPA